VLAGLASSLDAADGAMGNLDARVAQRMPKIARAIAGVHYQLSDTVRIGAVYRQRSDIPFSMTMQMMVDGEPIDLAVRAAGQYTPHQVATGIVWTTEAFATSLDIGWAKWSDYAGPYARAVGELPEVGEVVAQPPEVPFANTITVRAGIESLTTDGAVYRGGYGYESSPVPRNQQGVTNLLDGTKHIVAFGGGYVWHNVRLDAHVQLQLVSNRTSTKTVYDGTGAYDPYTSLRDEDDDLAGTQISNPGYPSIKSGGEVLSAGITLEVPL
jgi:long-subunit fatty acid transport protein